MAEKPTYEELEARVRELEGMPGDHSDHVNPDGKPGDAVPNDGSDQRPSALSAIIDAPAIQSMMDDFHSLTNIGIAILDLDGNVLVATGWQDICTKFHRVHPETAKNCLESDLELSNGVEPGTFRLYRCKNNMWDMATPIVLGGRKAGNLYLGQFLFDDETPDVEGFRRQARKHGFDEADYIAALERVPRWSRQTVNTVMGFYAKFAHLISDLGYKNFLLHQAVAEKTDLLTSLRESETKYRDLVENLNDVIYALDPDFTITYVSRPVTSVLGFAPEEILGKTFMDFIHPDDLDMIRRGFADVLQHRLYPSEYRIRAKDGGCRWVRTSSRPVTSAGRITGVQGVLTDITGKKEAEASLRQSTQRFKKVFDSQTDAIFVLNAENPARVLECNAAAATVFGYAPDEMIGTAIDQLHVDEAHRRTFQKELFAGVEAEGHLNHFEFVMKRKDGAVFPSEHSVFELKNDAGERTGWVSIVRDLSERRQIENRLRQAQKMESIGNLAGGIAHDFNNILYPIVGMAELLMEDLPAGGPEYENAREILKAGERGGDLVKQILAFSRQSEHKMGPVRVQHVLKDVLKLSRAIIPANIEIGQDIQGDCGMVMADAAQIHQIAMNLITNAYHAVEAKSGKIVIRLKETRLNVDASATGALEPGPYAVLSVSDTGDGIDAAVKDRVFEPYFTTKEPGKGTGLGLAVVYGIIREHKGDIKIESEKGKGTTVTVYLPLKEKSAEAPFVQKAETLQTGSERILLVDDEEPIVRLERQMLERLGYAVTTRTGSAEALDAFRAHPERFDLVITDMTMPNMTGDRLAREVTSVRPGVPVIICTGFSERLDERKAAAAGVRGVLMKPVLRSEMARMVRSVLDAARASGQNATSPAKPAGADAMGDAKEDGGPI